MILPRSRPFPRIAALCLAGVALSSAYATDYNLNVLTGTVNWNDGATWLTQPTDDATFPMLAGDFANAIANYTGNLTLNLNQGISVGRLDVGDTTGAETLLLQNGTGTQTVTFDSTSGNAKLNIATTGTGAITFNHNTVLADNLDITNGTHTVTWSNNNTIALGSNTLSFLGTGTATLNVGTSGNNVVISGTGGLAVNTTSTTAAVALFGTSTFSGGINLSSGLLVLGTSSTGGIDGAVTNGGFGTGTLTISGTGASTVRVVRATATGTDRSFGNSVVANADFTIGATGTTQFLTLAGTVTLGGNRVIGSENGSGQNTISGVIQDGGSGFSLTKTGGGTLRLSAANTYSGATIVRNNVISVLADSLEGVAGPLGNATSAVQLGDNSAGANTNNLALRVGADNVTIGRDILVTNQNGTGSTAIGNTGEFNATFSGDITLQKTLAISNLATNVTKLVNVTGLISGTGGIAKIDIGAARVSNTANSYSGTTTVRRGTLLVAGDVPVSTNSPLGNAATAILLADANSLVADNVALAIDGAFTIGRGITVNTNNSTGTSTLTATNATSTTATYGGTIQLNKSAVLANATAGATTRFSGVISGSGFGVTINGPGNVEFAGTAANTYTGLTTVSSGTLRLNSTAANGAIVGDGNTGTPDVLINGGTLLFGANNQLATNTTIQFTSGTLDLANNTQTIFDLDYTGGAILNAAGLTITNGTDLFLFDNTTIGANTTLGRKLIYAGSTLGGLVSGNLALDADPVHEMAVNDGAAAIDAEISGVISNETTASTITKRGLGTLKLSSAVANTFGGAGQTVTIEGGILAITADNQLGDAANTVTFTGGALRFDGAGVTTRTLNLTASGGGIHVIAADTRTLSAAGQLVGAAGVFTKSGAGTLVLTGDQSATWTGGSTALAGGTLRISAENQLGAAGNDVTFQGGALEVTVGFTPDAGKVFTLGTGGGTLNIASGQTLGLAAAGQLVGGTTLMKTGPGTLQVTAANAGLTAGATFEIAAGTVEIQNAQSLGNSPKAAVTLSGGALTLRNDAATSFNNPVTVTANGTVVSDVLTPATAGVTQTLGALSIGAFTLTAETGANVTGGAPAVAFASSALTGAATLAANGTAQLNTGGIALGANKLTLGGTGTVSLNGAISGGPGAGLVAIEKNDAGTALSSATASTFTGDVVINAGIYRLSGATALGNGANVVRLAGGTLDHSAGAPAYALLFNGGMLTVSGADRTWNGVTSATPSITFSADTAFSLTDSLAPATNRSINFGSTAGGTGAVTSTGPVNITVNANPTNTGASKLRFQNITDSGSVTGTLTINANAVGQIRSGGGTQNALGSGVLLRLNTGINLAATDSSGRLEVISDNDANFGNDVVLLGDSTINPQRINGSQTLSRTMTLNDLTIGNHTLVVDDAGGSNYVLAFDGITTLGGNATFHTVNAVTLASVTDGAGTFGITKNGGSTLTLNAGSYNGTTTINTGTLAAGAANIFDPAAPVVINGGTLAIGAFNQAIGALSLGGGTGAGGVSGTATLTTTGVNALPVTGQTITVGAILGGTGGLTKTGAGAVVLTNTNTYGGLTSVSNGTLTLTGTNAVPGAIDITGGTVNQGAPGGFSPANNVAVNGGRIDFLGRNGTLGNVTLNGPGNVNALGLTTGTNATAIVDAQITGTLTVNGDPGSAGTSVTINSGQMGSHLTANQVVITSGTTVAGTGAIFIGGNAPGSFLTIGAGGLQISNIASGAYNAIFIASSGGAPKINLGGDVTFTGNANPERVSITGAFSATGGQLDLGAATRVFNIGDGAGPVDLYLGVKTVGTGGIAKIGAGTLEIGNPGSAHTYTGITTVNDGTLLLTGSLAGAVTVGADGVLAGTGTIAGATTIGGALTPGASPGTLDVGDTLAFGNGSALSIELGGVTPGDGIGFYDQVNMTNALGSVTLGTNVTLSLALIDGYIPVDGDDFYILTRADAGAFASTFAGLPEGAIVNLGPGYSGTLTYLADWTGTHFGSFETGGNDVAVLNVVPEPSALTAVIGGLGLLASLRRRRARN